MKGPLHHFYKHVFFTCNLRMKRYTYNVEIDMVVCTMSIPVSLIRLNQIKSGFPEEHSRMNRKHVWFFAYILRMERGTVLILTSLSAQCQ